MKRINAAFAVGVGAIRANAMRSGLTMLGIIIGVASVITMLAIGAGATQKVQAQIRAMGSNLVLVYASSTMMTGVRMGAQSGRGLTEEDAAAVAKEVPSVVAVAPSSRASGQVVFGSANWSTSLLGTQNDYFVAREWALEKGRTFDASELQGSAKVAILGQTVVRELFGDQDPLEQVIRIKNVPVTVIGVLAPKGENAMGSDQDDTVIVPISTFRNRIQGTGAGRAKRIGAMTIKLADDADMEAAGTQIRTLLRQRFRLPLDASDDPFTVRNMTEMMQAREESSQLMTALLLAVASVSLVVGGIGIMNIMLVSVTERTREIGLRMAVGARPRDILAQFLIEAILLSALGGVLGVLLGVFSAWGVAHWAGWEVAIMPWSMGLAVGFAVLVGVFFGYYPAKKAAGLHPIEALRHE